MITRLSQVRYVRMWCKCASRAVCVRASIMVQEADGGCTARRPTQVWQCVRACVRSVRVEVLISRGVQRRTPVPCARAVQCAHPTAIHIATSSTTPMVLIYLLQCICVGQYCACAVRVCIVRCDNPGGPGSPRRHPPVPCGGTRARVWWSIKVHRRHDKNSGSLQPPRFVTSSTPSAIMIAAQAVRVKAFTKNSHRRQNLSTRLRGS
jgi:hypothetical protein